MMVDCIIFAVCSFITFTVLPHLPVRLIVAYQYVVMSNVEEELYEILLVPKSHCLDIS